jgi:hypothetical protein
MACTRPAHAHPKAVGYWGIQHRSHEQRLIEEVLKDVYSFDIANTTYELVKLGTTLDFIVSGNVVIRHLRSKGGELLRIEIGLVFHYEIKESEAVRHTFGFPYRHGASYDIDDEYSLSIFGEDGELIIAAYGNYANSPIGYSNFRDAVASHYHAQMLCAQHLYQGWRDSGVPQRIKALETQLRSRALDRALEGFSVADLDKEVARVFGDDPFGGTPDEKETPENVSN